jgi:DNA polymerase-3 subunit epsilon
MQIAGGLPVIRASVEELEEHAALLERVRKVSGGECVWDRQP